MSFNVIEYEDDNGNKPTQIITDRLLHYVHSPKGYLLMMLSTRAQVLENSSVLDGHPIKTLSRPPVGIWNLKEPPFHLLYSRHKIRREVCYLYFYEGTDLRTALRETERRVKILYP